jgi:hypothetical protein
VLSLRIDSLMSCTLMQIFLWGAAVFQTTRLNAWLTRFTGEVPTSDFHLAGNATYQACERLDRRTSAKLECRSMATDIFKIESRSIIPGEWGDYGHILQHGMASHSPRIGGRLALERTGPFIPPVTLPGIGDVVLDSHARQ